MSETLPTSVETFDTTLRDGTQREGISFSLDDKLRIARKLDELGVSFIEGGWPGYNTKDVAFVECYDHNPAYAHQTLEAANRCGSETLTLCDTNGGHLPWQVEEIVRAVRAHFGPAQRIGIHAHDDTGCGVANSIAAVRAGAAH